MKLLITLLILSFISYIKATEVYTGFTFTGGDSGCTSENGEFAVDTCAPLCGVANKFINIRFNTNTNTYNATIWGYKSCTSQYVESLPISCPNNGPKVEGYDVSCADPVKLTSFTSFDLLFENMDGKCNSTIEKLNTCTSVCDGTFYKIFANGGVNSYSYVYGNTLDECNKNENESTKFNSFVCKTNNVVVDDWVICHAAQESSSSSSSSNSSTTESSTDNSDSSSSIVAFSMTLLVSIVLSALLF